ncbi:MAG: glycosyltransferase, partial [Bacteroidia bacterium]|nr:glycosyltransferase [Bacteroidia bacterium]
MTAKLILYWICLGIAFRWKTNRKIVISHPPPLSILIAAHNAAASLRNLLGDLRKLTYPNEWEVIVIADRCKDETEELLQSSASTLPLRWAAVHEIPPEWQPKKYALWKATELAKYSWCVLIDADVRLPPHWLSGLMAPMQGKLAIIAPAWLEGKGGIGKIAAYEANLIQLEALGRAAMSYPYMATGRGWVVRKAWLQAGLFAWREEISGDDDLVFQL